MGRHVPIFQLITDRIERKETPPFVRLGSRNTSQFPDNQPIMMFRPIEGYKLASTIFMYFIEGCCIAEPVEELVVFALSVGEEDELFRSMCRTVNQRAGE